MKKLLSYITLLLFTFTSYSQKTYKHMMDDMSINFYDVCDEAEKYFKTHDPTIKGSGWKGYQRWRYANEYKYYPTGDRSNVDQYFPEHAYAAFLENNPTIPLKSINTNTPNPSAAPSPYSNGWVELGPFRIDSISGHYSAGLGRIEDHYVDPNNPNLIYASSRSGGFWRTTDEGANWQNTTDFIIASGVNTIAVSPTNPDSVLINVRNSRNGASHGIYRSIDGGLTWIQSNFNPTTTGYGGLGENFKIYEIKYHPRVADLIFVGTSKGIYRSDDNLATWTRLINSGDIEEIQFHPTNNDIVYLYDSYYWGETKSQVIRSLDQGLSYSNSDTIIGNNDNRSVHLSVSTACSDCLYFGSDNGVWKSIDNGLSFTFLSNPDETCGGFAVNDLDTSKMIYGYVDIDRSEDGGLTFIDATRWSLGNTNGAGSGNQNSFNTSTNYVHADLHPAKCVNGVFYIGTDGLFAKSIDNGLNWIILGQGLATRENYKLGASQSNHYRSISGSQDNGSSIKHQNAWIEFNGGDGMEGLIHPLNDNWILGSYQYGSRYLSKNGGLNSSSINAPGQSGSGNGAWEAPIAYDPNNQMTLYNFSHFIYKSEDFGSSWDSIGAPSAFTKSISQAAIAENNSNIIIISSGDSIEKSIDAGANFTDIKGTLPGGSIQDIAFDPNNDNTIIVVYARHQNDNEKVFKTIDGGSNWINITHNLGNLPIRSVVIDHLNASNIYLGSEIGVYTMPMSASNWVLYNPNLPNCTVEELEIVKGSNTLKGATWGRGMWEYTLVGRNDFPSILKTSITDQPTSELPIENVDQFVTSIISYQNTITSAYVEWSIDTAIFGNVIPMTNTMDSTWVSNTAIPNQVFGTKIYFKVFAVGNNNDTTETYKFMYTSKEFTYCSSSGTMGYQGNVTLVDFNSINNPTGKTQAYTDYTDTDSTTLTKGQSYDLSVNLNTDNGNFTYYATAWIDWNNDIDFDDSGEKYELGSAQNVTNGTTNLSPFSIIVPDSANIGETRMRVVCKYNSYQNDPCANGYDGEVEDYKLIIKPTAGVSYHLEESEICIGEKIHFNYTGDSMDSVLFNFSNGTTNFTSNNLNDSLVINDAGIYSLNLQGFLDLDTISLDSLLILKVNDIDSTTVYQTTSNPANIDTTYQTLTGSNTCDSIVTLITTLLPNFYWTGNTDTDWNTATNWSSLQVPTPSDTVTIQDVSATTGNFPLITPSITIGETTINSNASLTVNNGIILAGTLTNNGKVILQNGAYLDDFTNGSASYVGEIVVETNVTNGVSNDQRFISSAVNTPNISEIGDDLIGPWGIGLQGTNGVAVTVDNCALQTLTSSSNYGNIFELNETLMNTCSTDGWVVRSSGSLENARGYSAYLANGSTFEFEGTPNTGSINILTTNSGNGVNDGDGWNLIGNPYPSVIARDDVITAGAQDAQYFVTSGVYQGSFFPYLPTSNIAISQGFQVKVNSSGNINFTNNMRNTNPANWYSNEEWFTHKLEVSVLANNSADKTILFYNNDATNAYEPMFDVSKKKSKLGQPSLSTIGATKELSLNGLSINDLGNSVPMNLYPGSNGSFELMFEGRETFSANTTIYLKDLLLDAIHNIEDGNYSFIANTNDLAERFEIIFVPGIQLNVLDVDCEGNLGNLSLASSNYTNNRNFQLIKNNQVISSNELINLNESLIDGIYSLIVYDQYGGNQNYDVEIDKALNTIASFDSEEEIYTNQTTQFANNSINANSYIWNIAGEEIIDVENPTYSFPNSGTYLIQLFSANDECENTYSKEIIVLNKVLGIDDLDGFENIKVYSNKSTITIDLSESEINQITNVQLYNLLGQMLLKDKVEIREIKHIQLDDISNGYYFVELLVNEKIKSYKVVLTK